jgi:hypothetical protein
MSLALKLLLLLNCRQEKETVVYDIAPEVKEHDQLDPVLEQLRV